MSALPSIAVIGAGAIGQFYGAQFVQAGFPVRFIARRDRERLARQGLTIHQTATGQIASTAAHPVLELAPERFAVFGDGTSAAAAGGPADLILLAIKTTGLADVRCLVEPLLGPQSLVVALCNGYGVEDHLAAWAGPERVGGMLCFVCVNRDDDGTIRHLAHGQVAVGHLLNQVEPRDRIAAACRAAGIKTVVPPDLREARWRKLAWNIPFNGLCTVYDRTTDLILADPVTAAELDALLQETLAIGNADLAAHGSAVRIPAAWAGEQIRRTTEMGPYAPSTLLDRRAGLALETESLFGAPLRRARKLGIPAPVLARVVERLAGLV